MLQSFCQGRLFAENLGEASPEVVGLHGWARSRSDLAACLTGLNALLVDLPGFGASPEPPGAWGSQEYAEVVAQALNGLDRPQVLVGHSFGGRVAVKVAVGWPNLVSGLVLAGVPLLRSPVGQAPPWRYRIGRWGRRYGLVSDERMERLRQRYGSEDYRRAHGLMRSVLVRVVNESYEEDLPRIGCPVELVWGAKDTAAPLGAAEQACRLLPSAHLEVIENAGHMTPLTHPQVVHRSVTRLLQASVT